MTRREPRAGTRLGQIVATCIALGVQADQVTPAERAVIPSADVPVLDVSAVRAGILGGDDPLGRAFCEARSAADRRPFGQTFTPRVVVRAMLDWAEDGSAPARIVDPGCGSGRYIVSALQRFPGAHGVAIDTDPYAVLMTRANALTLGVADRLDVRCEDYRSTELTGIAGPTLYIGNPPYVRHHDIEPRWKKWLTRTAEKLGLRASGLAGLHAHFFLATVLHARPGDRGVFITSSEWLDTNYGRLMRKLLCGPLSVSGLHVIDPTISLFEDATVTGTITCFTVGDNTPTVRVQNVGDVTELGRPSEGLVVSRQRMARTSRWSTVTHVTPGSPEGYVELGELTRVHRGTVTGMNRVWIVRAGSVDLPDKVLFPAVTRARELFATGDRLVSTAGLKQVIDLPVDLDVLDEDDRERVDRFLCNVWRQGAADGYIVRSRRAWWHVGLAAPAPILATYMARRPPAFVRNVADVRHVNIAHGIYPRDDMAEIELDRLATYLRAHVSVADGRIYAGGLTKFEPREMERLMVPGPDLLRDQAWDGVEGAIGLAA